MRQSFIQLKLQLLCVRQSIAQSATPACSNRILALFDFIFARNISIASRQKVCCKYFIGKVCAKWLLDDEADGRWAMGDEREAWHTNKLGAKLAVIGFYVRRLLAESWAEPRQRQRQNHYKEHNLIFVCPNAQKSC